MKAGLVRVVTASLVVSMVGITASIARVQASQPSYFDQSFGTDGVSTIELPKEVSPSNFDDVQVDATGKLLTLLSVAVGQGTRAAIGRRSAELVVDTSFGSSGSTAYVDLNSPSMLLQPDGKILLAGTEQTESGPRIALRRYRDNGQIDQSFGTQGVATIAELPGRDFRSGPLLAVVASTGRIIIAINVDNGFGSNYNFYFFALNENGKRDYDWGYSGGREIIPRAGGVSAFSYLSNIAVLADGSVIGVGNAYSDGYGRQLVLIKLTENGFLDQQFDGPTTPGNNGNGMVIVSLGSTTDAFMSAITLLSNGNIVVAGAIGAYYWGPWSYGAAQFRADDGTLVSSFGTNGFFDTGEIVNINTGVLPRRVLQTSSGSLIFSAGQGSSSSVLSVNSTGTSVNKYVWNIGPAFSNTLQVSADGTIVICGQSTDGGVNALIARMSSSGIPMTGPTGFKVEQFRLTPVNSEIVKSLPQSNGTIISLVDSYTSSMFGNNLHRPVIARFTSSGATDSNFGTSGLRKFNSSDTTIDYEARDVVVQPDGKIVVLVQATDGGNHKSMIVWRLLPDGSTDTNFGDDGEVEISMIEKNIWSSSLVLADSGKILLAGELESDWQFQSWFFRLNANGEEDTTFRDSNNIAGRVKVTFNTYDCYGCEVFQGLEGRIMVRGQINVSNQSVAVMARYLPNGTLDTSFSDDGFLTFPNTPFNITWITDALVTPTGDIVAVAESMIPDQASVLIRVRSNGTLDTSFNSTGLKRYNLQSGADYTFTSSVTATGTGYTVVGAVRETDEDNAPYLATIGRIGTTGEFESTFGTNGISSVPTLGNTWLFHVASINDSYQLVSGRVKDANGNRTGILIRLGNSPSSPTSTVASTTTSSTVTSTSTSTTTTIPATTSTTSPDRTTTGATTTTTTIGNVPTPTTLATAASAITAPAEPKFAFVLTLTQASILKSMNISIPSGGKVAMSIAATSTRVCKIVGKKVAAISAGTCRVTVSVLVKGKKINTKTLGIKVT